MDKHLRTT